jgi:hypothetical protein
MWIDLIHESYGVVDDGGEAIHGSGFHQEKPGDQSASIGTPCESIRLMEGMTMPDIPRWLLILLIFGAAFYLGFWFWVWFFAD